jgi:hypothetical protein
MRTWQRGYHELDNPIQERFGVAQRGLERADVSDSTNPLIIKTALQQRTQAVSKFIVE